MRDPIERILRVKRVGNGENMNCDNCNHILDEFLDDELEESVAHELKTHVENCEDCNAALKKIMRLRQALKAMPYQPPEDGFYDRLLEQTVKSMHRNEMTFWATAGVGSAIAASVVAWLVLALPVDYGEDIQVAQLEGVTISLNVEKTIRISFESVSVLQGATLTVQLPPGVQVSGYDGQSEITWTTNVTAGVNILSLPVVLRSGTGGTILARVDHLGKSKSFQFDVSTG